MEKGKGNDDAEFVGTLRDSHLLPPRPKPPGSPKCGLDLPRPLPLIPIGSVGVGPYSVCAQVPKLPIGSPVEESVPVLINVLRTFLLIVAKPIEK